MVEILTTIILACQVNTGFRASNAHEEIDTYQKQCQQKLIKCVDDELLKTGKGYDMSLKVCLLKR